MTSPFQKYFLSVSSLTVNKQTKKLNKKKKNILVQTTPTSRIKSEYKNRYPYKCRQWRYVTPLIHI